MAPIVYALESREHGRRLLERLAVRFPEGARRSRAVTTRRVYLDTFDWRLWRSGRALAFEQQAAGARLRWIELDGTPERAIELDAPPRFGWELPRGLWRETLGPVLDVRRLLEQVTLEPDAERLELLDDVRKTIARVELVAGDLLAADGERRALPCRLVVRPLRGYDQVAAIVCNTLAGSAEALPSAPSELELALATLGREPEGEGAKFRVALEPGMTAGGATRAILAELLHTVRANEPGLRADLDPEFLHDARVAIRRARTCLGQLRGSVAKGVGRRLRDDLSWLGRATGECRDLDVHLLQLGGYRASLPESARDALVPLREQLRARRRTVRGELLAALDSPRYPKLLERWERLSDGADDDAPDAGRPAGSVAAEQIARRVRRMVERGRAIDQSSPDEALHALRIDAKKLRYLFEFFRELFDAAPLGRVIDRLKRLQDTLGEFNDLSVQRASLERFAGELAAGGLRDAGPLLAIGRLVARLDELALARRDEFAERFDRFAAPKNIARVARLLDELAGTPGPR